MNRKWISDLVEPRKKGTLSRAYDCVMLVAIVIGTVPLLFREQKPLFVYFDVISGVVYLVDYILRWVTCDLRSDKPKWKAFLLYPFTPMAIMDFLSILPTFHLAYFPSAGTRIQANQGNAFAEDFSIHKDCPLHWSFGHICHGAKEAVEAAGNCHVCGFFRHPHHGHSHFPVGA